MERIPTYYPSRRRRSFEVGRRELLPEIVSALTGTERDRKECSIHLQLLKNHSAIAQSETDTLQLIQAIFGARFIRRSALAGALFGIFHKMEFGRGLSVLERLHHSVSPALFAATTKISFTIDDSNRDLIPWHMFHRGILPCLRKIFINLDFDIEILWGGHEKSLWTTLEEHMQETAANSRAKQIILWLSLRHKHTSECNAPEAAEQLETMLAPRMGWKKDMQTLFVPTECQIPNFSHKVRHMSVV